MHLTILCERLLAPCVGSVRPRSVRVKFTGLGLRMHSNTSPSSQEQPLPRNTRTGQLQKAEANKTLYLESIIGQCLLKTSLCLLRTLLYTFVPCSLPETTSEKKRIKDNEKKYSLREKKMLHPVI